MNLLEMTHDVWTSRNVVVHVKARSQWPTIQEAKALEATHKRNSDGDCCVSHLRIDHALFCSSNHIALQLVQSFMDDSKEPEDKCKIAAIWITSSFRGLNCAVHSKNAMTHILLELSAML